MQQPFTRRRGSRVRAVTWPYLPYSFTPWRTPSLVRPEALSGQAPGGSGSKDSSSGPGGKATLHGKETLPEWSGRSSRSVAAWEVKGLRSLMHSLRSRPDSFHWNLVRARSRSPLPDHSSVAVVSEHLISAGCIKRQSAVVVTDSQCGARWWRLRSCARGAQDLGAYGIRGVAQGVAAVPACTA